ncbi:hypothetical protein AACH06_07455 [Ideonella sp. DXS29W]|uniref:Uncharacterized protein n=1 Tax=Ideonella lacteola TaxID=2984193 RepID=A0ABU9BP21_9BURK
MLIADKLVFIEFRNTGASHVEKLLQKIFGGEVDNKHKAPGEDVLSSGRVVLGSVRDPWGWYLSLWSAGCAKQGDLYQRLTSDKAWVKIGEKLEANAKARTDQAPADQVKRVVLPDDLSAHRATSFWYADPDNVEAFREWLRVVCSLQTRRAVDPSMAKSPIGKIGGLMTYRYFLLYVRGAGQMPVTIGTQEGLRAFEASNAFVHHVVRHDSLTEDLVMALERSNISLSDEHRKMIYDTKAAGRPSRIERFYDESSMELVARREKFIIERFGYQRPHV